MVEILMGDGSINRNIVECKDKTGIPVQKLNLCINRNIVECKGKYLSSRLVVSFVLIETLWNVKYYLRLRQQSPFLY